MSGSVMSLLGWLPASEHLAKSLEGALKAARETSQEEVSVSHVLAALIEDTDAVEYLASHRVERKALREFCENRIGKTATDLAARGAREVGTAKAASPSASATRATAAPVPSTSHSTAPQPAATSSGNGYYGGYANGTASPATTSHGYASSTSSSNGYGHSDGYNGSSGYGATSSGYRGTSEAGADTHTGSYASNGYDSASNTTPSWSRSSATDSWSSKTASNGYGQTPATAHHTTPHHTAAPEPTSELADDDQSDVGALEVVPSSSLRRVMALASQLAEAEPDVADQSKQIDSKTVIRAIALDGKTATGRHLKLLLPAAEIALAGRLLSQGKGQAAPANADGSEKAEKPKAKKQPPQPAFDIVHQRTRALMKLLERELQRDYRYRLSNDLATFVESQNRMIGYDGQAGNSSHIVSTAMEVVSNAKAELGRDPAYRAFQQVAATSDALLQNQARLHDELQRLLAARRPAEDEEIVKVIAEIIKLPEIPEESSFDDDLALAAGQPASQTTYPPSANEAGPFSGAIAPPAHAEHFTGAQPQPAHLWNTNAAAPVQDPNAGEPHAVEDVADHDPHSADAAARQSAMAYLMRMFRRGIPPEDQAAPARQSAKAAEPAAPAISAQEEMPPQTEAGEQPDQSATASRLFPIILTGRTAEAETAPASEPASDRSAGTGQDERQDSDDVGSVYRGLTNGRHGVTSHIMWFTVILSASLAVGLFVQAAVSGA